MVVLRWWGAGGERWSGEEKKIAVCVLHSMDGRMGGLEGVLLLLLLFLLTCLVFHIFFLPLFCFDLLVVDWFAGWLKRKEECHCILYD